MLLIVYRKKYLFCHKPEENIIYKIFSDKIVLLDQKIIKVIECEYSKKHSLSKSNSEGCQI